MAGKGGELLGFALVIIGIVVMLVWSVFVGVILILVGLALMFAPVDPYGYSRWRGRRGPPP